MHFTVRKQFGPAAGDKWKRYLGWRGLSLTSFDSIDGSLRPSLFSPSSRADWGNCVNADHRTHLITNRAYASAVRGRYGDGVALGVECLRSAAWTTGAVDELLGFDILDARAEYSLLTNWGADPEGLMQEHIGSNGLVGDLGCAFELRKRLGERFVVDAHAADCEVWAVCRV